MADEEILKVLSNRANQAILGLLTVEPTYPRKIAGILSLSETEVARRLKQMEALRLVEGTWGRVGKNVKLYRLIASGAQLRFRPQGIEVELPSIDTGKSHTVTLTPMSETLPTGADCVGREVQLAALDGPERVLVVDGMLGIGKSTLVANFANLRAKAGRVFWHSFRGVESLNWLANRMGMFFAQHGNKALLEAVERGADVADKRELLLRSMDDATYTIIFDDVQRVEDEAVKSFIGDVIERIEKAKVVISGRQAPRYRPTPPRTRALHLEGLTDAGVAEFLAAKEIKIDPKLLPKIREEVGGHPLALNLLLEAARERNVPVQDLLDRIPEHNLEEYLLKEVYTTLSDDEKRALSLSSLFRTRFTMDDLGSLTEAKLEPALLQLRRRLLVQSFEGEFALHEIVRNFFYTHLQDKGRLHVKVAERYRAMGTVEGRFEAMHHYLTGGHREKVLDLLEENLDLKEFDFIDAGYQNLYLSVLDIFTKTEVGAGRKWALIEDERGDIYYHRRDLPRALKHYKEAGAHFDKSKDQARFADLAWKRALCHQGLGDAAAALAACEEGLTKLRPDATTRERLEATRAELRKVTPAATKVKKTVTATTPGGKKR